MKKSLIFVLSILIILCFALITQAQNVTQTFAENQTVNWTNQVVRAIGIGAPNPNLPIAAQRTAAIRAAKLDAVRNLLETIKGIYLTSETTVRNSIVENDVIRTRVEGLAQNFKQVEGPRYMSDGSVEVVVEMPITGAILDALLPSQFGGGQFMTVGQMVCPTCGQPWPQGKPVPPGVTLQQIGVTTPMATSGVYTGLVVDCKGLGVRPAMAPKIVDEQGNEIYGSKFVSRQWAVEIGMVGYDKDLNRARQNDRVTNNPLVVKGLQASGPNKTDVVISSADASLIHQAAANQNFLDKCKVMFIVN
ncbi:MAG: LPP20 family lipoprotein [bacterium]|nr:MAG: LPP20 family lipoprotein [bacterium]